MKVFQGPKKKSLVEEKLWVGQEYKDPRFRHCSSSYTLMLFQKSA